MQSESNAFIRLLMGEGEIINSTQGVAACLISADLSFRCEIIIFFRGVEQLESSIR